MSSQCLGQGRRATCLRCQSPTEACPTMPTVPAGPHSSACSGAEAALVPVRLAAQPRVSSPHAAVFWGLWLRRVWTPAFLHQAPSAAHPSPGSRCPLQLCKSPLLETPQSCLEMPRSPADLPRTGLGPPKGSLANTSLHSHLPHSSQEQCFLVWEQKPSFPESLNFLTALQPFSLLLIA